jgi:hypothetical protein
MDARMMRGVGRVVMLLPVVSLAACRVFPAPTPPVPLAKPEAAAIAKCSKTLQKAQLGFVKTQEGTLASCLHGVLGLRLSFENGLATQEEFDAGLVKMRAKCRKGYAKITAASTKLVDAIVKDCTPAQTAVLGAYDALRFQSFFTEFTSSAPTTTDQLAGAICALTVDFGYAHVGAAAPRLMELLGYLGPEFFTLPEMDSGFPNVPLDPRCGAIGPPA